MIKTLSAVEGVAYHVEIPGSRVGPDDGPWPRPYQILAEAELARELELTAKPLSFSLGSRYSAYGVNFQPCHVYSTQDRYTVRQLNVHGRVWTFTGVFDGHLGDLTVEHTAYHLPIIVKELLSGSTPKRLQDPAEVSRILSEATTSFDRAIAGDIIKVFPGGMEALANMPQSTIQNIINRNTDPQFLKKARLCMYGTTALVALVDPDHQNLWVANVGDCQAVFVSPNGPLRWKSELLTSNHNCDNDAEVSRVVSEHPGEPECILDRRVLGALAPTRCIGDIPFKQPSEFTRKILYNIFPGYRDTSAWDKFLDRNLSPPYITAEPEVTHRKLCPDTDNGFLILCSDGLADLWSNTFSDEQRMAEEWGRIVAEVVNKEGLSGKTNLALKLLRHSIGGDDAKGVSRVLTLDMNTPWIDDTTIVIQTL
ncbi:phosphatase 2C-like domain-containing protein [Thelephora terrestris]|uniref:Phosphatase 2C-like domain-containing protein n=1 Tax=Thelephora terrestris TaxID=56493 RepID=A0A9P6HRK7_9AGAM|nr:phosphatase 2C-like domain-containing protein [Thelephora terrestris]